MAGHLLVVDDSPTVRKLVELTFRESQWRVDYASTGGEALQIARRTIPDVILLDYVLPDIHGIDVCEGLAKDASTAEIPIVVMSGKETAPDICRNVRSISCYLTKPSTPERIRTEVEAAAQRGVAAKSRPPINATFAQKEAAARALFAVLRDEFAGIPRWLKQVGDSPPAAFIARKVLTPQLMGELLDALAPHFRELLGAQPTPTEPRLPVLLSEASFAGSMRDWPVVAIVSFFESSARSGSLTLRYDGRETIAYLRAGEVVGVTTHDPVEYMRGMRWSGRNRLPPEAIKQAAAEQQRTGTPVLVTLAANGHFPPKDLTIALAARGRKLLMDALGADSGSFQWSDLDVLPAYVEAHGRHISTARNTLPFTTGSDSEPAPSCQRSLEQLRHMDSRGECGAGTVFTRPRGFSEQVMRFSLTAAERQVLTWVDGAINAEQLAASAGLDLVEVLAILERLSQVRLICVVPPPVPEPPTVVLNRRVIVILEPDREGFKKPLASMLRERAEGVKLVDLEDEQDLLAALRRERPYCALLNAAAVPIVDLIHRVRSELELSDLQLVAILESDMAASEAELRAAGISSVLVKPIARAELEELFSI